MDDYKQHHTSVGSLPHQERLDPHDQRLDRTQHPPKPVLCVTGVAARIKLRPFLCHLPSQLSTTTVNLDCCPTFPSINVYVMTSRWIKYQFLRIVPLLKQRNDFRQNKEISLTELIVKSHVVFNVKCINVYNSYYRKLSNTSKFQNIIG